MKKKVLFSFLYALMMCWSLQGGYRDHLKPANDKNGYHNVRNVDFIYVINLDERPERLQSCIDQLHPYGIYPYRFSAVNGWKLSIQDINDVGLKFKKGMDGGFWGTYYEELEHKHEIIHKVGRTYFCHCLAKGTIGIALSHLSILQDAYNSGYETIWVMEDDIQVLSDPNEISNLIEELDRTVGKKKWDILFTDQDIRDVNGRYVPCSSFARRPDFQPKDQGRFAQKKTVGKKFRKIGARFGAHSMILRRSGIKKILDYYDEHQIFLPYDMDNFMPNGIQLYTVINDIVIQNPKASSDNGVEGYLTDK